MTHSQSHEDGQQWSRRDKGRDKGNWNDHDPKGKGPGKPGGGALVPARPKPKKPTGGALASVPR